MAYSSSIYNNIYNYYNSVYQPKTSSRFDAHNKSELKKIYNSIVGISKEEPVFLLDRQPEIETYTIAMKESAMQFGRDIRSMGGLDAENMFEQKNVFSSLIDLFSHYFFSFRLFIIYYSFIIEDK